MKLYVCYGKFDIPFRGHPCHAAYEALVDSGHKPEVKRVYGWGKLPDWANPARKRVRQLTGGSNWVPVLEGDNGELLAGNSRDIIDWARSHPAR